MNSRFIQTQARRSISTLTPPKSMPTFDPPLGSTLTIGRCNKSPISDKHQAQLVLFQPRSYPSTIAALIPMSSNHNTCVLQGRQDHEGVDCYSESSHTSNGLVRLGWSRLEDVHLLMRELLSSGFTSIDTESTARGLTWCTYNALGVEYTLKETLDSLQSLPRGVDAILLDDGWQDVSPERTLVSYSASQRWLGSSVSSLL